MELQPRKIDNDEYLTQYGSRATGQPVFWDHPRSEDRGELSVTVGRLAPAEIRRLVRFGGVPTSADGARYARTGDLRDRGFEVTHKPSSRNPDHAVVCYPSEWDVSIAGIFNKSLSAPVWYDEPEGGA